MFGNKKENTQNSYIVMGELLEVEKWKMIEGIKNIEPGYYEVSNMGNVRIVKTGRLLVTHLGPSGCKKVNLRGSKKGTRTNFLVHRLVAKMFVNNPFPDRYWCIVFNDHDIANCRASNLSWAPQYDFSCIPDEIKYLITERVNNYIDYLKFKKYSSNDINILVSYYSIHSFYTPIEEVNYSTGVDIEFIKDFLEYYI